MCHTTISLPGFGIDLFSALRDGMATDNDVALNDPQGFYACVSRKNIAIKLSANWFACGARNSCCCDNSTN